MKRAFSTVACMGKTYKEIAEYACDANLAVEIRLDNDGGVLGLHGDDLKELSDYFNKNGVVVSNIGTSVALFDYEPQKIESAKKAIMSAKAVGASSIRVFLGGFIKKFSQENVHSYDGIVKALKELCEFAKENEAEIWVETHNNFSTGKVLKKLCEDVGYENLKIIWDIIHPYELGESPKETLDYLGDKIAHVHIKDGKKHEDPDMIDYVYTVLGEGELPIREIVGLLKDFGFDGYLSLEWENEWREEIKGKYTDIKKLLFDYNAFMDSI